MPRPQAFNPLTDAVAGCIVASHSLRWHMTGRTAGDVRRLPAWIIPMRGARTIAYNDSPCLVDIYRWHHIPPVVLRASVDGVLVSMHLLIVEDEAIIARDLATTVESFGHAVIGVVGSGEEALALATIQRPDLVLMDIRLSGPLDGIATAQQLQAQQFISVIYLTAHADDQTMSRAASTHPVGYLLKPFDERTLWSMLEIAHHQQQMERSLQAEILGRQTAEDAQQQAEATLRERNMQLEAMLRAQESRTAELRLLGDLGRALTTCATLEDGYAIVTCTAQQLFPDVAGVLYVLRHTPPILDSVIAWGTVSHPNPPMTPVGCRVLREGRIFLGVETCGGCRCDALPPDLSPEALCVPLSAMDETLGVLHVHLPITMSTGAEGALRRQLALAFGEQVALGLANVRLRHTLREQAICDPLTGLFNRRYLEETLTRELHRATRNNYPVGVIMLDIDYFKQINDTYGHDAGDTVLRTLGALLLGMVRAGDVACRYGGEEFVLILPSAPTEVLASRAEAIRYAVSALEITHRDLVLPPITVSLGTSLVTDAQASVAEALAHADAALYAAKRAGRNCVISHTPVSPPTV